MIERIIETTRKSVSTRTQERPLEFLKQNVLPTKRSLYSALRKDRSSIILECKKASPSMGVIRRDFNISKIVEAYAPFADAVSVLTNEAFFQGSHQFLKIARKSTDKPLLCKDFILSPYQVFEARYFDADAILLMMSLLSDHDYIKCVEATRLLKMDVLTEVHDEAELDRALNLDANIIGVNNRDFKTLTVDLAVGERLLPKIPKSKVRVLESGISSHVEIIRYASITQSFLVGTSLMKKNNLHQAVRELVFGRVKVCGLMSAQDAQIAYEKGAQYGGVIFAPDSVRCVSFEKAAYIVASCPLSFVGVFVNQPIPVVAQYAQKLGLRAVQLHGDETFAYMGELKQMLGPGCEIWKAYRVKDKIPNGLEFGCDRVVLDTFKEGHRGGTGDSFDWTLLKDVSDKERFILSGGISLQNAKEAQKHGLFAIDVNSGVESSPAVKDPQRLHQFFEELR